MIRTQRLKSLRDICLDRIQAHDLSMVNFEGIPPHLIDLILKNVSSPSELARIQNSETNKNSKLFANAVDERWHQFVLSKFWVGKRTQPELRPNTTWKMFYEDLDRKNKEAIQQQLEKDRIMKAQMKKKKSKIIDEKAARQGLQSTTSFSRSFSGYRAVSPANNPNVGKGARDLLKKIGKYNF